MTNPKERVHSTPLMSTPEGQKYFTHMREMAILIAGILRIMHPDLYCIGYQSMENIKKKHPDLKELIQKWGHPFTAGSFISNQDTPLHRDRESRHPYYDFLTSVGPFPISVMQLHSVGFHCQIKPGGAVAFCGSVVVHEVRQLLGDRLCGAFYMRGCVHASTGIMPTGWMDQSQYIRHIHNPPKHCFPAGGI